jgi:hypothetical protein
MGIAEINQETIELTKAIFARGPTVGGALNGDLQKDITVATMPLTGYELEAPAKSLYPVQTPLRNMIARRKAPIGSDAAHWKAITGINTGRIKAAVAFGTRNGRISYGYAERSSRYKTFGLDDAVQFESVWISRNFQDVRALSALALLQSVMIEEEKLILGGASDANALGAPATPSSGTISNAGGQWTSGTNNAYCAVVPLPLYGYLNSDLAGLTALGDHGLPSPVKAQAIGATTNAVTFAVTPVNGAVAYAWFLAEAASTPAASAMFLAKITTTPSASFTAAPTAGLALSTITSDTSGDPNAFDGILAQLLPVGNTLSTLATYPSGKLSEVSGGANAPNTLVYDMANDTGTNAGGRQLTSDGAFGIVEFDIVLKALFDRRLIGPTMLLVNSQEALTITKLCGQVANGIRVPVQDGSKNLNAGIFFAGYTNKFTGSLTPGNPDIIPIMIHPFLPPGTVIFISERLPYPNNEVPNVLEMELQQEYADFEWALTQRQYEHGVYAMGTLKHYFPAGCAVIRGIAPS